MELQKYIDHTNLKMDASSSDIARLCHEAMEYGFHAVCVHPAYVSLAKELLDGSSVSVCAVIGFPFGMNTPKVKVFEAVDALENGADEFDMVINVGALKDMEYDYIKREIEEVRDVLEGKILKVIIETSLLTEKEIEKITEICNETFVNFIKTSTGFGSRGVSLKDIDIINKHRNDVLEIKASGGIKSLYFMTQLIERGVTRIGTSNGISICKEVKK